MRLLERKVQAWEEIIRDRESFQNMACWQVLYYIYNSSLKLKFRPVSGNILLFTYLKFQAILETLESQVWWIWVILTENDS